MSKIPFKHDHMKECRDSHPSLPLWQTFRDIKVSIVWDTLKTEIVCNMKMDKGKMVI